MSKLDIAVIVTVWSLPLLCWAAWLIIQTRRLRQRRREIERGIADIMSGYVREKGGSR